MPLSINIFGGSLLLAFLLVIICVRSSEGLDRTTPTTTRNIHSYSENYYLRQLSSVSRKDLADLEDESGEYHDKIREDDLLEDLLEEADDLADIIEDDSFDADNNATEPLHDDDFEEDESGEYHDKVREDDLLEDLLEEADDLAEIIEDDSFDADNNATEPLHDDDFLTNTTLAWHEQVEIPYVEKDSLLYDIALGVLFATVITAIIVFSCFCSQRCCKLLCCPDHNYGYAGKGVSKISRLRRRIRLAVRPRSNILFTPLKQYDSDGDSQAVYDLNKHIGYESWSSSDEEDGDLHGGNNDTDRMEYGESIGDDVYNDDMDYNLSSKQDGRYEESQIEDAAKRYFDEDRVKDFFKDTEDLDDDKSFSSADTGDADSESSDTPLDLEMIERKIADSMNKTDHSNRTI